MEVIVHGQSKDLRISTITLTPDVPNVTTSVHCPNCGDVLTITGGKIAKIYPFYEPTEQLLVTNRCRKCLTRFTFQTYDAYASNKIRVILHPTKESNAFWCVSGHQNRQNCKILEYTDKYVVTIEDKKQRFIPFNAKCYNTDCDKQYWFAEII